MPSSKENSKDRNMHGARVSSVSKGFERDASGPVEREEKRHKRERFSLRPRTPFFFRKVQDEYTLKLIREMQHNPHKKRQKLADKQKREKQEKKLDLISFAFSLLKRDFGISDFAKINPLLVLAVLRVVMDDGLPNDPKRFQQMLARIRQIDKDNTNETFSIRQELSAETNNNLDNLEERIQAEKKRLANQKLQKQKQHRSKAAIRPRPTPYS